MRRGIEASPLPQGGNPASRVRFYSASSNGPAVVNCIRTLSLKILSASSRVIVGSTARRRLAHHPTRSQAAMIARGGICSNAQSTRAFAASAVIRMSGLISFGVIGWLKRGNQVAHYSVGKNNRINFIYEIYSGFTYDDPLGLAVEDLRFYYYYGACAEAADSSVNWGSNDPAADTYLYKLPKKIKIVLKTRDEEAREDTQTFETTVFIPGAE